jgi:hypothetical protein
MSKIFNFLNVNLSSRSRIKIDKVYSSFNLIVKIQNSLDITI